MLYHGCATVAHCVTAWWRNFSHYCLPLRQYDVWFTCSEYREELPGAPTAHGVHKQEFTVQGGSTYFATEEVGRLRYVTAVDGRLEAFPLSIVICAPVCYTLDWKEIKLLFTHSYRSLCVHYSVAAARDLETRKLTSNVIFLRKKNMLVISIVHPRRLLRMALMSLTPCITLKGLKSNTSTILKIRKEKQNTAK